jgi:hypothetical protein
LPIAVEPVVKKPGEIDSTKGLKDFYQGYFDIGVAVGPHIFREKKLN